ADEPVAVAPVESTRPEERASTVATTLPLPSPSRSTSTITTTTTSTSTTVDVVRVARARWMVSVDERPFYRRLRWNDDLNQVLRRYDLAANAVGVGVGVRPWRNGFVLGVSGEVVV